MSIYIAHLAQLNFQSAIIIKSALKLQASANYYLSPIKDNIWNKILNKTELESRAPYLK